MSSPAPPLLAVPTSLHPVLALLLKAHDYATDVRHPLWDFAVALDDLRPLGLTDTDLRWLVCRGYVTHAPELAQPGNRGRCFGSAEDLTFARRTCVVLTKGGVGAARACSALSLSPRAAELLAPSGGEEVAARRPHWDGNARALRLGVRVIKQFRQPALSQEMVLQAFEEEDWPEDIADPLPPQPNQDPKCRLHRTVNNLNRAHRIRLLRFLACNNAEGIGWRLLPEGARAKPERSHSERC